MTVIEPGPSLMHWPRPRRALCFAIIVFGALILWAAAMIPPRLLGL
jgi:hypothetical protein